jgi:hypothetical protein
MGIEIRLQKDTLATYTFGVDGLVSTMRAHTESTSLRVRQGCAGSGMWAVFGAQRGVKRLTPGLTGRNS